MELSFTEENYLKAIYQLSQGGEVEVTTNLLAETMQTRPASVSDMIRKLSNKGVITYEKYQGVNISETGKFEALKVIRKHRLWEVFLVSKLNFSWEEVHEVAEQLEHIKSSLLIKRLDDFLGHPKYDPHGDPIPDENGRIPKQSKVKLSEVGKGNEGEVVAVSDSSKEFLHYLNRIGVEIGSKISISDRVAFDGSMEILINGQGPVFISKEVSENILIAQ